MIRLDDLDLPVCRLIKVDVEGMELSVLKGGRELIARNSPILYVENNRDAKSDELIRWISGIGYQLYWHYPPLFNPNNFNRNTENVFVDGFCSNMLCVPNGAQIQGLEPVAVPA